MCYYLLVPDLEQNLLSVGQLVEHGYKVQFQDNSCKIFDKNGGSQVIANIKMEKNRKFPLIFKYGSEVGLKIEVDDPSWLLYRRLEFSKFEKFAT